MDDPFAEGVEEDDPFVDQAPKDEPSSGWSPAVFWVGASLTAVSAAVTTWSGLDTQNNPGADVVRKECAGLGPDCKEYKDGLSRQRRTNILLGTTGGLAAFSIVAAVLTDWSDADDSRQHQGSKRAGRASAWSVTPWVSVASGAAVGATGRF
jgi:hypothetical protein